MAFEMDGKERRKLREALVDSHPTWKLLDTLIGEELGPSLNTITAENNPHPAAVFDVINWARSRGRLAELVLAARRSNPGNGNLFEVARRAGLTATREKRSTLEKIVSENSTFLDVAKWRADLTRMEWRVCRIDYNGRGQGTGFLVAPDTVLTNCHVVDRLIAGQDSPSRLSCRFDYKVAADGSVISSGESFHLADDWLVDHSPPSPHDLEADPKTGEPTDAELDFAMLRLKERAGEKAPGGTEGGESRGWVPMPGQAVDFAAQNVLAILQHPLTLPLKLALGMAQQVSVNAPANRIRYTVPTEPGSSGSPIFNMDWRLLALHHSGDPKAVQPEYNEAIPISKIAVRERVAAMLQEIDDE